MTHIGIAFAVLYLVSLRWGRRGVASIMVLAAAFYDSAALNSGPVSVSPFYLGALLFACLELPQLLHGRTLRFPPLEYLLIYSIAVTVICPIIFAGIPVIASGLTIDKQWERPGELAHSISNIAQVAYLGLNTSFVLGSMREGLVSRASVTASFWIGTIVGVSNVFAKLAGIDWPTEIFHNSDRGFYSIETNRFFAQFAEPSHFGAYSLAAFAYFLVYSLQERRPKASAIAALGALMAGVNASASFSATAYIGAALLALVTAIIGVVRASRATTYTIIRPAAVLFFVAAAITMIFRGPEIISFLFGKFNEKTNATGGSFQVRTYADSVGIDALWDTFGLGAGLGSNRTSSLLILLLSTVGIVGATLFAAVTITCIYRGSRYPLTKPGAAALAGHLAAAVVAFPDFSNPVMWMLIAFVLGHAPNPRITLPHAAAKGAPAPRVPHRLRS